MTAVDVASILTSLEFESRCRRGHCRAIGNVALEFQVWEWRDVWEVERGR